ncbi:hypothetical protein CBS115989_6627 [Aspergillus niger]|uniref:Contig An02c0450, genomic contig n=3 Tax=Aspergillus niger TaxID=5061 RepID=A2QF91_ASPNC|nr:uncharacterized protein An02g13710 [Aspergillus niger]XP_025458542.1 WSC-domain-containing protein [Aspergillus niger CBS 101883]RDH23343.1 WSC-domain-containing protein [Aspergillus niger ATCC 13496]KAI2816699.1 hypothetical protein CBS115989_6627 [Aspergillus niger]KAI2851927.1 hypothetical protein CBS11232_5857 [Aspergillus niger]KAI2873906.1 hypothetical protein CBS115988_6666 [Aspergillus niger]KAI2907504.1 hypothetical protein CBS11852_503 [Aspergillus niger]|eukprot:XP_001400502.1 WSC domain protein [Aspergillus niger CBS 513.88]
MPKASATKIISLSIFSLLTTASAYTIVGCYSSPGQLTSAGTFQFQSEGYCQQICTKQNKPIFALYNGDECYCGDALPPSTAKVSSTQCETPCSGFPSDPCGGTNAWLINNSTTISQPTTDNNIVTELKRESTDNVENGIVIAPESDDSDSSSGNSNSPETMTVNPTMVETGIPIAPSSGADGGAAKSTIPSVILTAPSMTGVTVPATGAAAASSMVVVASSASASATAAASGAASSGSAAASPSTSAGAAAAVAGAPAGGMIGGVVMAAIVALGL